MANDSISFLGQALEFNLEAFYSSANYSSSFLGQALEFFTGKYVRREEDFNFCVPKVDADGVPDRIDDLVKERR